MPSITVELNVKEIEKAVGQLSISQKVELVRRLEKETIKERWNSLLKTIHRQIKRYPLTEKQINKEIEEARKSYYAKRGH